MGQLVVSDLLLTSHWEVVLRFRTLQAPPSGPKILSLLSLSTLILHTQVAGKIFLVDMT